MSKKGSLEWVRTPEDGTYAMLIAVMELAWQDVELCPDKYKRPCVRRKAERNRRDAETFLADLRFLADTLT